MYPEGTVSLEITRCARTGRLISGPVMWTVDFGPGRVEANAVLTPDWDKWAIEMRDHGILIMILLPNSTALTALMDKLFGPFKAACRENSQVLYAKRIQEHSTAVNVIKAKMSRGEEVTKEEKRLTRSAVRMKQEDVGEIVFGELQEDGQPHPESPFIKDFTPEKIMHGAEEVSLHSLALVDTMI